MRVKNYKELTINLFGDDFWLRAAKRWAAKDCMDKTIWS